MSRAPVRATVGDQITQRLTSFGLTTAARELVSRFVQAEQQPALPLLLEVLDAEAQERHARRITRLRRASKLPPGKTFATLDEGRLPPALVRRLHELADGDFLDDATNVLAFGLPGAARRRSDDHALSARERTCVRACGAAAVVTRSVGRPCMAGVAAAQPNERHS